MKIDPSPPLIAPLTSGDLTIQSDRALVPPMRYSDRITNILEADGSDGWGLYYKARAMVAEGHAVTQLTIGEHDIRTDPRILEAMDRAARAGHTGYSAVPGTQDLREAIAKRVTERSGVATTPDEIVVTAGGQAALFAAHMALCNPGDAALYIDPYYATYPGTLRSTGAVPAPVLAQAERGFQPEAHDIRAAAQASHRPASLLINSPNNPTGVVYTAQTMQAVAETCRDLGIWLISDEVYEGQVWRGQHISAWSVEPARGRCLVVNSMSKSFAMTGSRIGWIQGPPEAIEHLINLSTNTTYGVPGYIQDAALFALHLGPALEAEVAAPFQRRREIALRLLQGHPLVRYVPCDGAMYIMLDIRATGLSGEAFAEALLLEEHIAVMPGESFGRAAAGHLRVAMTVDDAAFEEALARLLAFALRLRRPDAAAQ